MCGAVMAVLVLVWALADASMLESLLKPKPDANTAAGMPMAAVAAAAMATVRMWAKVVVKSMMWVPFVLGAFAGGWPTLRD